MKLKKLLSLALLLMGLTLSCSLTACGDDKDKDEPGGNKSELIGYWYWEEDGEFEAMSLSEGGSGEYLFGTCGDPGSIYSDYITWNENQVQGVKVLSVDSRELVQKEDDEIIVYKRITAREWGNLKKTATLDGSNSGNTDIPDTPGHDTFSSNDFIGKWSHPSGAYVFDLQSSNIAYMYILQSWRGDTYSDKVIGTWEYQASSSKIVIETFKGKFEEIIISSNFPNSFKTSEGVWERCSTLPTPYVNDSACDDPRIYGTWVGKDYKDSYTLTFEKNGKFNEVWREDDGSDSYEEADRYTFKNGKLSFEGEPGFVGLIGYLPFDVEFSSGSTPTTMYMSCPAFSGSMKFTRK